MPKNCVLIPRVEDKNGKKEDSRLFKNLLSYIENRADADRIYRTIKNPEFDKKFRSRLVYDKYDEPTLISLLKNTNLSDYIPEKKLLEKLNREIGYYKKGSDRVALWPATDANYKSLLQKAINFNSNSEFKEDYVAKVLKIYDKEAQREAFGIKIEKRNKLNSMESTKMEYNYKLNERLKEILASKGISIGALTDLEKRMGVRGVADFDVAKNAANGLIEMIRLAEGIEGEKALPEEFAHFAIEAMEEIPLVNRLINYIHSNNLTPELLGDEFDTYNTLYDRNTYKLAKEAAGKLLATHLLKSEPIGTKPYKNLLERVINAVKDFFRTLRMDQIQRAIYEVNKDFGVLASNILSGKIDAEIDVNNISSSELFYNTNERIQRDKRLLQNIINNELKRLKIYEKRNPDSPFDTNQRQLIDNLTENLLENNEIEGIYSFLDNALAELQKVDKRLKTIENDSVSYTLKEKASVLRDIKNYISSYANIITDIRESLLDEEKYEDNRYGQRVRVVLDNTSNLIGDLNIKYNKVATPLFVDFIKPFVGENIVVPFGKYKGKVIRAEDLVKVANSDISFFDRWLDSMADSSDYMLKIMDQAVKKSKEQSRLRTIDVMKQLQAATIKLEQSGINNTDWMFERDSKGNLSGNYISEINQALFREKLNEMYKSLNAKYGKNPIGEDALKYKKEKQAWFEANMEEVNGKRQPKMSIYADPQYKKLNQAQREYYRTIMDIKAKLDSYLPVKDTDLTRAVAIRKDLLERVKSSDSIKSGLKQIWEGIKDEFVRRSDDTDFGSKAAMEDFGGNVVHTLPIYFTKLKEGESPNDLSTDITSTLTAYASMAIDFDEMNKVVDVLELGRDILRDRKITQTQGDKPLVEKFKVMGNKIENTLTKRGESTRFIDKLDDFFEMQVYGKYMKDEGTFSHTKLDKGKMANNINRLTAINNMALNILSGISNIATGTIMMRIESIAGEFFKQRNVYNADKIYSKYLPSYLSEIGSRVKTNKLALWNELFNVEQDHEKNVREVNFDRKTWFSRMFNTSTLFFINNAGEHWMQSRTSLALADTYKMKAPNGKIVSLWDAMEVVYIDKNNKKLGAKLQLKPGYTKADGSAFTKEDIIRFSRKSAAINERMHGIYNKADRSAVQRVAIGRMGLMFRKWIKPSLNRRFESATYNYDLQAWTEGYYNTTFKFLVQLAKDLRETQINLAARWNSLTPTEKANIKRATTEVGHFLLIAVLVGLLDGDKDKERPWLARMAEYQARRLYTEIGVMIPGKSMVTEGLKILKSPAAGINTMEDALNLINLMNPLNYEVVAGEEAIIQSGRFKGESKAYKIFFTSPIIPLNKTIYRGLHPEESIPFYKQ